MSKDWPKIEGLFHQAVDLSPTDRASFLAAAAVDDEGVRAEVETLLAAADSGNELPHPFLAAALAPGQHAGRFEIVALCGKGTGGTVYRAHDPRTDRDVAIKLFPLLLTPEQQRRHMKEVQAASVVRHRHVVAVVEAGKHEDRDFLVMEYVDGPTLGDVIPAGGMAVEQALDLAGMILEGISAAHAAGIVHRDLKPSNVMLTRDGSIKVLDFGLAKVIDFNGDPLTASMHTTTGQIVGTACYLSPEQARGETVDVRTDIFSFGAILYEMLTGERPFDRGSLGGTLAAILRDSPPPVRELRSTTPRDVSRLVRRCLEKDREKRYESADELLKAVRQSRAQLSGRRQRLYRALRRPVIGAPIAAALALMAAGLTFTGARSLEVRRARTAIEPEIARLVERRQYNAADQLVHRIEGRVPNDPAVRDFIRDYRVIVTVETSPAGAEVAIKDYATPDEPWRVLGRSPLKEIRMPLGYMRWRVRAAGHRTREFAETAILQPVLHFNIYPEKSEHTGMETVPAGATYGPRSVQVPEFALDRYEVSNRKYQEFVDAGGYLRRELWQQPFTKDGKTLSSEEALTAFRDQTGKPGPAGWQLGRYPEGQDELPVTGVSWYEAAAYANFAGKRLPAYVEWVRAARTEWLYADALLVSNFSGKALAPVGSYRGLDRFGTYDLAGNCKEWLWNEWRPGERLTMGGSWNEAMYAAGTMDASEPWARNATTGFRCAASAAAPSAAFLDPVKASPIRDYKTEQPVGDDKFAAIRLNYEYARTPLNVKLEASDDSNPNWRTEKISFDASYPGERVTAFLFLPRGGTAPYQTVVYFASGIAFREKSSERLEMWFLDPLIRSGRAVLYPVLWGMYERKSKLKLSRDDRVSLLAKRDVLDLRRSLDYLETRPEIDSGRLAYFGFSAGSVYAPIALATEMRFKAAELAVGGLEQIRLPVEADPFQFAPRARVPVLMMNGRYDVAFPLDTSSKPLFELLGAASKDKRMVLFEAGHAMVASAATTRESLEWLDRYLGPAPMPVKR